MSKEQLYIYEFSIGDSFFSKTDDYKPYPGSVLDYYTKESKEKAEELGIYGKYKQDAFRHTWTSADVAYKHGQTAAKLLGNLQELNNAGQTPKEKNQDLWNNDKGRELGEGAKNADIPREKLPKIVKQAMNRGDLITNIEKDKRVYKEKSRSEKKRYVIWVSNGGCAECQALDGQKFEPDEVPDAPHPGCNCTTMEIYE